MTIRERLTRVSRLILAQLRRQIVIPVAVRIILALYVGWAAITTALASHWRHWVLSFGLLALLHATAWFFELRLTARETPRA